MAYVKPVIRIRENGRHITRGCYHDAAIGRFIFQASSAETLKVRLDFTDILDGETITIVLAPDGLTASSSIASGVVTLTLSAVSGQGNLDVTSTFSGGRVMQTYIRVSDPSSWARDDYGLQRVAT